MKKAISVLLVLVMVFCLAACGGGSGDGGGGGDDSSSGDKLQVAFVYNDVVGDYGWFWAQDRGRQAAQEALDDKIETTYLEKVAPGSAAERVIGDLAAEGYDVIVAASADFEADVKSVAENYPDTYFLICCGAYSNGTNVESFYSKSYQLAYLMGKLAAWLDVDTLGVVGAVNSPMDLQVQNAYLRGAQSVNPDVQQRIIYTNTYYDPAAERDAALSLIDAGAGCILQATNSTAHVQAAEEKGVYAMSEYEDMSEFGPNAYVTGEVLNWGIYYTDTLEKIADGTFTPVAEGVNWIDFSTGIMEYAKFGPMVTDDMKAKLDAAAQDLIADPDQIWRGPIYDNTGTLRVPEGEVMSDEMFTAMDWWVQGTITAGGN